MPDVLKREMHDAERQHETHRRQPKAESKAVQQRAEKPEFQHREFVDTRALPLDNRSLQGRHRHEGEGLQKAGEPVRRDQCCCDAEERERAPTPNIGRSGLSAARDDHGLDTEK